MPALHTCNPPSQSLEVITDTAHPLTLAIVSPALRSVSFPLNQTETCPISSPFEPGLRKRRPRKGDDDVDVERPESAFILFRRQCCENCQAVQEEAAAVDGVMKKKCQAGLSKAISLQWKALSPEERLYWEELAKEKKKEHEQMYPDHVYRSQRTEDRKGKKGKRDEEDSEVAISFVPLCVPAVENHGRSASVPTQPPFQAIQIPSVYMPSCLASPSMVPMINQRTSHPNHGSSSSSQFDIVASNTAIRQQQYPPPEEPLESRRSRLKNYCIAPLRKAVGRNLAWIAESRRTTSVSAMEGHDLSTSNLLEPTLEAMIKMSIAAGQKQYLQNFRRKVFFRGPTLRERLDATHKDIGTIWNLHGLDHFLKDDKLIETFLPDDILGGAGASQSTLKARMTRLKLDDPQFIPNMAKEAAIFVIDVLRMPYQRYQEFVHGVEIFMTYIVNLICVMQVIFLLAPDHIVTRDTVDRAIDVWKNKREQLQISIKSFVKKQALRTLGQDQVLNGIETLIWQCSMSEQEVEELSQEAERLRRKEATNKAGASSK